MSEVLFGTVPAFLAILLGGALRYRQFVAAGAWAELQKLNYYLFLPAMFVSGLAGGVYTDAPLLSIIVGVAVVLGAGSAAIWFWKSQVPRAADLGPQLLEGAIRANVPYGMAVSFAFGGGAGLELFLVAAAVYLPTVVIAGGLYSQLSGRQDRDPDTAQEYALATAFRLLARNPIAIGIVLGVGLNVLNLPIPTGLGRVVHVAGFAAMPIGLLATGAALNIAGAQTALDAARVAVIATLALKLLVLPAGAGLIVLIFGLSGPAAVAVVLISALPCLVPRFTVVAEPTQGILPGIATLATLLSAVTIPVALWLFS